MGTDACTAEANSLIHTLEEWMQPHEYTHTPYPPVTAPGAIHPTAPKDAHPYLHNHTPPEHVHNQLSHFMSQEHTHMHQQRKIEPPTPTPGQSNKDPLSPPLDYQNMAHQQPCIHRTVATTNYTQERTAPQQSPSVYLPTHSQGQLGFLHS